MDIPIIFQDDSFLIIDKPSGIVVNRSENAPEGTVQDWIESRIKNYACPPSAIAEGNCRRELRIEKEEDSDFIKRSGIVHRIDKETSGLLIIAKTSEAFENLQKQFLDRTVTKKYLTLVHGKVVPQVCTIKAPVGRLPWNRRKFGVLAQGRNAETSYKVLKYYYPLGLKDTSKVAEGLLRGGGSKTLLEVSPHTGRTHQIRIHFQHLGFPIVSDPLYLPKNIYEEDVRWCSRLFLHAAYLRLKHPQSGEWKEFESNLPHDLEKSLKTHLHVDYDLYQAEQKDLAQLPKIHKELNRVRLL